MSVRQKRSPIIDKWEEENKWLYKYLNEENFSVVLLLKSRFYQLPWR